MFDTQSFSMFASNLKQRLRGRTVFHHHLQTFLVLVAGLIRPVAAAPEN